MSNPFNEENRYESIKKSAKTIIIPWLFKNKHIYLQRIYGKTDKNP